MSENKLISIEALRFISAFAILIVHYQHFAYENDTLSVLFNRTNQPFYDQLKFFYNLGARGVLMFWCISGFIFFYKYLKPIQNKNISAKKFFVARFSRLYPLHFATLILVLILQAIYNYQTNTFFVYPANTLENFFYHLIFISGWYNDGAGFNAPIWSVSIELIVYILYFYIFFYFRTLFAFLLIIPIFLFSNYFFGSEDATLTKCLLYFFFGGFIALIKYYPNMLTKSKNIKKNLFNFLTVFLLIFSIYLIHNRFIGSNKLEIFDGVLSLIFSGLLICLVINMNHFFIKFEKIFIFLGNLTYSSYLCHFPVQIIIIIILNILSIDVNYQSSYLLFFYLLITLSISAIVYRFYEYPVQNYIRSIYFKKF